MLSKFASGPCTWPYLFVQLWKLLTKSSAEVTIGIVCVSAPALRPLMKKIRGRKRGIETQHKSATDPGPVTKSGGTKVSFALGSLKRPEKSKVRLNTRENSSVEQFRPNDVNRTITEIEAGEGHRYERCHDDTSENDSEDRGEFVVGGHGILRRMEVAVTISDRV